MYLLISRNGNGVYILSEGMMGFCIIQKVYTTGLYLPVPLVLECHVLFHFLMSPWPSFSVPRFLRSKLIIIISYPAIIKWISIEHIVIIAGQIDKSFPSNNQMDLFVWYSLNIDSLEKGWTLRLTQNVCVKVILKVID